MKVLITGGAGFIGSHLAQEHVARGDTVTVLDDLSCGKEGNLREVHKNVTFVRGDAGDRSTIERLCRDVDGVHHLAAAVGVKKHLDAPTECLDANIQGIRNICEHVTRHGCKLVFASSCEIYGAPGDEKLTEDHPMRICQGARWAYAISKLAGEFLVRGLGGPAVSARLFNVVGPRQELGYCMSSFVNRAKDGRPIEVYGDGTQRRTLCYVTDIAWALAEMMHHKKVVKGAWNVGGTVNVSMKELAESVFDVTGTLPDEDNRVQLVPYSKRFKEDPQDPMYRDCDCSKLDKAIGWNGPKIGLEGMIRGTLNGQLKPIET